MTPTTNPRTVQQGIAQNRRADEWWLVRLHRAELLRACCANAGAPYRNEECWDDVR
jgi:hypothetical protein